MSSLESVKQHEASHAAAYMLLNVPVVEVSALPGYGGAGYTLHRPHRGSIMGAFKRIVGTLAGVLEDTDWSELKWGQLNPQRSRDERDIVQLIEAHRIPKKTYEQLFDLTVSLVCSREFDRLQGLLVAILDDRPVVSEQLLEAVVK